MFSLCKQRIVNLFYFYLLLLLLLLLFFFFFFFTLFLEWEFFSDCAIS